MYANRIASFMGVFATIQFDVYWSIIWAIYLIITRVVHGGRVIAGDLCAEGMTCDYKKGYMYWTA